MTRRTTKMKYTIEEIIELIKTYTDGEYQEDVIATLRKIEEISNDNNAEHQ